MAVVTAHESLLAVTWYAMGSGALSESDRSAILFTWQSAAGQASAPSTLPSSEDLHAMGVTPEQVHQRLVARG